MTTFNMLTRAAPGVMGQAVRRESEPRSLWVVLSTSRLEPARACQGIAGSYKFGFRICIE